jgi:hypothetical protein
MSPSGFNRQLFATKRTMYEKMNIHIDEVKTVPNYLPIIVVNFHSFNDRCLHFYKKMSFSCTVNVTAIVRSENNKI